MPDSQPENIASHSPVSALIRHIEELSLIPVVAANQLQDSRAQARESSVYSRSLTSEED